MSFFYLFFLQIYCQEYKLILLYQYHLSIYVIFIYSIHQQTMSLFRSTEMRYYKLHIPKEDTYEVISRLAQYNFAQFVDCNPNTLHHPYTNSLKRCEEVLNKLGILLRRVHKEGIELPQVPNVEFVFENHRQYLKKFNMSSLSLLDKIETEVEDKFKSIEDVTKSLSNISEKVNEFQDHKYLLFKARQVFHSKGSSSQIDFNQHTLQQLKLVNISGIIQSRDLVRFTRVIFRVTKGNSVLYTFSIPRQTEQNHQHRSKTAFICVVQNGDALLSKISKICDSFGVKQYQLPTHTDQIFEKIKEIEDNITETKQNYVLAQRSYNEHLHSIVKAADFQVSLYDAYKVILEREVMIFHALNMMQEANSIMIGSIWIPADKSGLLYSLVPSFVSIRESQSITKPPTHFQMNQFTAPFQQVVNTYGVPRYQQVNPALYAIPIFPFLFGVMFGDIGHGGILLAFGIWLTSSARAKKMMPDLYGVRYLVLLMGIFSFYSGWIYNQFFSIPLNLFGTCYKEENHEGYAIKEEHCVYPFGFDPKWFIASNDLNYFNSYKMKFAVIVGVFQMSFAILLKMMNTLHFKNYLDFIFEWLPQQVFFFCTFGYMCFLIIYKWTIPWGEQRSFDEAPSIIGQMIALPLKMGSTQGKPLWNQQSQEALQYNLLMISLWCIPFMLIPKPLIIWFQSLKHSNHQQKKYEGASNEINDTENELGKRLNDDFKQKQEDIGKQLTRQSNKSAPEQKHEEHDISEVVVHQIIETIEFILGSISNTASYLRLWALSLAHGQLSKVFLQKTVGGGITSANILVILIGMYMFFNVTVGVIMCMDAMECFLHALRLQWVEFQGKFYKADGWKFQPLSFTTTIQAKANATRNFD